MIKISDSELQVMKILWSMTKATSLDIIKELQKLNNWNVSTIRTLMGRLQSKGAIDIVEKKGRIYTYKSIIKENEYQLEENKNFLQKVYNGSINDMLLNFVKQKKLSKRELESLISYIESEDK